MLSLSVKEKQQGNAAIRVKAKRKADYVTSKTASLASPKNCVIGGTLLSEPNTREGVQIQNFNSSLFLDALTRTAVRSSVTELLALIRASDRKIGPGELL